MARNVLGRALVVGALTLLASTTAIPAYASVPAQIVFPPIQIGVNATDPPGDCRSWEAGTVKLGPDNVFYKCTYVRGEGYYWLPW